MEKLTDKIKLIAIDLDGTLFDEKDQISESTLMKLDQLGKQGIFIVPATGRCAALIPEQVTSLTGVRYGITENGASIWDFHRQVSIRTELLHMDAVSLIMTSLKGQKGYVELSAGGKTYASERDLIHCKENIENKLFYEYFANDHEFVHDLFERKDLWEKAEKMNVFYMEDYIRIPLVKQLNDTGLYQVTSSMKGNMEINSIKANKGCGLTALCDYLNLDLEAAMAIGDGDNDIEMMRQAGIGIAMENADIRVKEAAVYITKSNEKEGVYWILDQLF